MQLIFDLSRSGCYAKAQAPYQLNDYSDLPEKYLRKKQ